MTLEFSGTEGTCDHFSLNVNILGKAVVLHLVHFCSWGCAKLSLQFFDTAVVMYSASTSPPFLIS
jgi:hypothetical protein